MYSNNVNAKVKKEEENEEEMEREEKGNTCTCKEQRKLGKQDKWVEKKREKNGKNKSQSKI